MLINTTTLIKRTGATRRQVDYWCRNGVISPIGEACPGSGYHRKFDNEIIPRVKLLAKLSDIFDNKLNINKLKKIYDTYDKGFIDLGESVILYWRTNINKESKYEIDEKNSN